MARRKSEDSKTAAILKYAKEHPQDGPSAIAAALSEQGTAVSAQYVSTIKSKFGVPGPRKRRGRPSRKGETESAGAQSGGGNRGGRQNGGQSEGAEASGRQNAGRENTGRQGGGRQAGGKQGAGRQGQGGNQEVDYDNLLKAKEFVQSQGGMERAKRVLEAYANLSD